MKILNLWSLAVCLVIAMCSSGDSAPAQPIDEDDFSKTNDLLLSPTKRTENISPPEAQKSGKTLIASADGAEKNSVSANPKQDAAKEGKDEHNLHDKESPSINSHPISNTKAKNGNSKNTGKNVNVASKVELHNKKGHANRTPDHVKTDENVESDLKESPGIPLHPIRIESQPKKGIQNEIDKKVDGKDIRTKPRGSSNKLLSEVDLAANDDDDDRSKNIAMGQIDVKDETLVESTSEVGNQKENHHNQKPVSHSTKNKNVEDEMIQGLPPITQSKKIASGEELTPKHNPKSLPKAHGKSTSLEKKKLPSKNPDTKKTDEIPDKAKTNIKGNDEDTSPQNINNASQHHPKSTKKTIAKKNTQSKIIVEVNQASKPVISKPREIHGKNTKVAKDAKSHIVSVPKEEDTPALHPLHDGMAMIKYNKEVPKSTLQVPTVEEKKVNDDEELDANQIKEISANIKDTIMNTESDMFHDEIEPLSQSVEDAMSNLENIDTEALQKLLDAWSKYSPSNADVSADISESDLGNIFPAMDSQTEMEGNVDITNVDKFEISEADNGEEVYNNGGVDDEYVDGERSSELTSVNEDLSSIVGTKLDEELPKKKSSGGMIAIVSILLIAMASLIIVVGSYFKKLSFGRKDYVRATLLHAASSDDMQIFNRNTYHDEDNNDRYDSWKYFDT